MFQGKGEVFTYWLISEDENVREQRLLVTNPNMEFLRNNELCVPTPPEHKKGKYNKDHRNSSFSDINNESPKGGRRRSCKEKKLSPEGNFFDIVRETDVSSQRSGSVRTSFRRRRSLDSRPRSKEFNKQEVINVNGCLFNHQHSTDAGSPPNNDTPKYPSSKELQRLPSIVVDNPNTDSEVYVPKETDRLLDSGVPSDRSNNDTTPDQSYPSTQEMVPMKSPDADIAVSDGRVGTFPGEPTSSHQSDSVM